MHMTFPLFLVSLSAAVVLASCVVLALHKDYHCGVTGTLALALLAIAAVVRLHGIFESHDSYRAEVTRLALFNWVGLALWLGRTVVHFLLRLRTAGQTWYQSRRSAVHL